MINPWSVTLTWALKAALCSQRRLIGACSVTLHSQLVIQTLMMLYKPVHDITTTSSTFGVYVCFLTHNRQ